MPHRVARFFPSTTLFRSRVVVSLHRAAGAAWGAPVAQAVACRACGRGGGSGTYLSIRSPQLFAALAILCDSGPAAVVDRRGLLDRKSTRLNSSHGYISYAAPRRSLLSLHDALPISSCRIATSSCRCGVGRSRGTGCGVPGLWPRRRKRYLSIDSLTAAIRCAGYTL